MQNMFARTVIRTSARMLTLQAQHSIMTQQKIGKLLKASHARTLFQTLTVAGFLYVGKNALTQQVQKDHYEKVIDDNFQEGERRAVQVGEKEDDTVMVVKYQGKYYCLNDKCPHFGFSLTKGPMFDDKVVCPLHMASFSVKSGIPEYGPVFDGLEMFDIRPLEGSEGAKLIIRVPINKLNKPLTPPMVRRNKDDKRRYLIVGGGPAGLSAAETLRQAGFTGEIVVLAREKVLPYDRTLLSKNLFGAEIDKIKFRDSNFFEQHDITFEGGVAVKSIDTQREFIETTDGRHLHYEGLIIASGGQARIPEVPGTELGNVFTLREWEDVKNIREGLKQAKKLVIIGASFIGLESASSIKQVLKQGLDITVVDGFQVPFQRALGSEVGQALKVFSEQNGVNFKLSSNLQAIEGDEHGKVKQIKLTSGEIIQADAVLLGTGMVPNSGFVSTNIKKNSNGAILTDVFHRTNVKNVYAVGDVAAYPYFQTGQFLNIQHYNDSIFQGYVAALNLLGKQVPNDNVPFFWTRFFNKSLQYTGTPTKYDEVFIDGNVEEQKFIAWYFWNNRVVAAAAMGLMPHIQVVNEALRHGIEIKAEDIKSSRTTIEDLQAKVKAKGHSCRCKRQQQCKHGV